MTTDPTLNGTPTDSSLIDEVLDIDDLLASKIERAEKTEVLYTKPHLEARIDALEHELERLTDGTGTPINDPDAAVGDAGDGRTAEVIAREIQALRQEYSASGRLVRLRQLPSEDWTAFEATWKEPLGKGAPYPQEMWDDLISKCAVAPEMPIEKVRALRSKLGHPPLHRLALTSWELNTQAGVSVPFSRLSSAVLKPRRPETS